MITNRNYNLDLAKLSDKELMYNFAKEMTFDLKAIGKKLTRDRTLKELLKTPGLKVSASGVSKTIFLSSYLYELCDRLGLLLQEKQAGKNSKKSDRNIHELVATVDKLIEYKSLSKKKHKQVLIECNLLQKQI